MMERLKERLWLRLRLYVWRERAAMWVAWAMPRWLVYWCAVRLAAEVTTRDDATRYEGNVPDMTYCDALGLW